jgi:hypothetical protein
VKLDELLAHLENPVEPDDPDAGDGEFSGADDPDISLSIAMTLLHDCGELLDMLSDKQGTRLSKREQQNIARIADAVYEFLQTTDIDYEDNFEERT